LLISLLSVLPARLTACVYRYTAIGFWAHLERCSCASWCRFITSLWYLWLCRSAAARRQWVIYRPIRQLYQVLRGRHYRYEGECRLLYAIHTMCTVCVQTVRAGDLIATPTTSASNRLWVTDCSKRAATSKQVVAFVGGPRPTFDSGGRGTPAEQLVGSSRFCLPAIATCCCRCSLCRYMIARSDVGSL